MMLLITRLTIGCAFLLALISMAGGFGAHLVGGWQPSTELAYICDNRQICLTDVERGRMFYLLRNSNHRVEDIAWSPDGQQLAYTGEEGVYVLSLNGTLPRLVAVDGYNPVWSPDGTAIVYVLDVWRDWWLTYDPLIGNRYAIITHSEELTNPALSPDGQNVVFQIGNRNWAMVNIDGSGLRTLPSYLTEPAWSPDGSKIAAISIRRMSPGDIVIIDTATWEVEIVIGEVDSDEASPSWSSDGRYIAFASNRLPQHRRRDVWGIYVANADGSNAYYVDTGTHPTWRPDPR